ncbi:MAG: hypothetical protein Harvfovirus34_7 [Harvfovirus sp.]|uniref:Uncharacterized protein n=1 Tax=Harvfovirus sp. TaxID=2487768 RepID=A0A3G5A2K5_9VIRU|nr:MAG: hypothetical protein Harvfovirus34_7 [Harvfovirus sp.]
MPNQCNNNDVPAFQQINNCQIINCSNQCSNSDPETKRGAVIFSMVDPFVWDPNVNIPFNENSGILGLAPSSAGRGGGIVKEPIIAQAIRVTLGKISTTGTLFSSLIRIYENETAVSPTFQAGIKLKESNKDEPTTYLYSFPFPGRRLGEGNCLRLELGSNSAPVTITPTTIDGLPAICRLELVGITV